MCCPPCCCVTLLWLKVMLALKPLEVWRSLHYGATVQPLRKKDSSVTHSQSKSVIQHLDKLQDFNSVPLSCRSTPTSNRELWKATHDKSDNFLRLSLAKVFFFFVAGPENGHELPLYPTLTDTSFDIFYLCRDENIFKCHLSLSCEIFHRSINPRGEFGHQEGVVVCILRLVVSVLFWWFSVSILLLLPVFFPPIFDFLRVSHVSCLFCLFCVFISLCLFVCHLSVFLFLHSSPASLSPCCLFSFDFFLVCC